VDSWSKQIVKAARASGFTDEPCRWANMLADALKSYGGIVMWRAFVYSQRKGDRARQAYTEFLPLDGQFRKNVIIQVKKWPCRLSAARTFFVRFLAP